MHVVTLWLKVMKSVMQNGEECAKVINSVQQWQKMRKSGEMGE